MARLPNGTVFSIASAIEAADPITAITNANPAVATLTAGHGLSLNDVGILVCDWGNLTEKAVKITALVTNDATLGGLDTTSTTRFPAGGGVGSFARVTSWITIPQIINPQRQGGDQQYVNFQFVEADNEDSLPTVRSARSMSMKVADPDVLTASWYTRLRSLSDTRAQTVLRATLRNGGVVYYVGTLTMAEDPSMEVNQLQTLDISMSIKSNGVSRY